MISLLTCVAFLQSDERENKMHLSIKTARDDFIFCHFNIRKDDE
jgi:hypothetical protein